MKTVFIVLMSLGFTACSSTNDLSDMGYKQHYTQCSAQVLQDADKNQVIDIYCAAPHNNPNDIQ